MAKLKSISIESVDQADDKIIEYLQLIQEPICRMSTTSAIFKGFSATIVAGVASLNYSGMNNYILCLSFIPVLLFAFLDIYYLRLEKKYRYLYEEVRTGKHAVNFSMELTKDTKAAKARVIDCVISPSIIIFYPVVILILTTVVFLSFGEVL